MRLVFYWDYAFKCADIVVGIHTAREEEGRVGILCWETLWRFQQASQKITHGATRENPPAYAKEEQAKFYSLKFAECS